MRLLTQPADVHKRTDKEHARDAITRLFLAAFLGSCVLFWWLTSIFFRCLLQIDDPVTNSTIGLSILSVAFFVAGYLMPNTWKLKSGLSRSTQDRCEEISYRMTKWLFIPAMILAVAFTIASAGKQYGEGGRIVWGDQIIYYLHLFFGFMFLGLADDSKVSRRKVWIAIILVVLPRLIVSLHYGRAFLALGVVPIAFIVVARGFIRLTWGRVLQLAMVGLLIMFVPSITRGDKVFSQDPSDSSATNQNVPQLVNWIAAGSSLQVTQDYLDLDLRHACPPMLVSFTEHMFPYVFFHLCTVMTHGEPAAADLDRLVSHEINGDGSIGDVAGTGTSYLLELYLTGGVSAVVVGSLIFGFVCRALVRSIGGRSIFSGIWAICLMRAIWAPRSMLGYVFEIVPGMLLLTFAVVVISFIFEGQLRSSAAFEETSA